MPEKNIKEAEAEVYNEIFKKKVGDFAPQRLKNQWNRSGFYKIGASYLPKNKPIIELGCGDGFFTNFIDDDREYLGIDFCDVLIEHGKKLYPKRNFMVGDLRTKEIQNLFNDNSVYVCFEVMEHIKDELSIIEKIPTGCEFIFSVPSAKSAHTHVRYFESFQEIRDRYDKYLEFIEQKKYDTNHNNYIRVSKTVKK